MIIWRIIILSTHRLLQSNETGGSNGMEKEGLRRSLAMLEEGGVSVSCLVTDRHPQIQKFMTDNHSDVEHFYDVWHVAKGMVCGV